MGVANRFVFQGRVFEDAALSPGMYGACKENARVFEGFGVWTSGAATLTGMGDPEQLVIATLTQGVLPVLSVPAFIGRWFSTGEDRPGSPETVILSYGYWQRKFGGDLGVLGRTMMIDFIPRQVMGVMPRDFRFCKYLPRHTPAATISEERSETGRVQLQRHCQA